MPRPPKPRGSAPRVVRGPPPRLYNPIRRTQYRKTLPELRRDFGDRCAYCMAKLVLESSMEVDHFDPRRKNDKIQLYSNLFLADRGCNAKKGDNWPTKDERAAGARFLNCCEEADYGESIFEDPDTHLLVGTTPAAKYHILVIDLNRWDLVELRRRRTVDAARARKLRDKLAGDAEATDELDALLRDIAGDIPEIPPPPNGEKPDFL